MADTTADILETSTTSEETNPWPSLKKASAAVQINNIYLEDWVGGYYTLSVEGRESLTRKLTTSSLDMVDGAKYVNRAYEARTITVNFVILHEEYDQLKTQIRDLNGALNSEEFTMIFDDEPDVYYTGTVNESPSITLAHASPYSVASGSFQVYCSDPFKHSVNATEVYSTPSTSSDETEKTNYTKLVTTTESNYTTYPKIYIGFPISSLDGITTPISDCGYVKISRTDSNGRERSIQVGDDSENQNVVNSLVDVTLSSLDTMYSNGWRTDSTITHPMDNYYVPGDATTTIDNKTKGDYLQIKSYGTRTSSINQRGTFATRPFDSTYFEYSSTVTPNLCLNKTTATGNKQCFSFWWFLYDSDKKPIVGVGLDKSKTNTTKANLYTYDNVNGVKTVSNSFSVEYVNPLGYYSKLDKKSYKKTTGSGKKKTTKTITYYEVSYALRNKDITITRTFKDGSYTTTISFPMTKAKAVTDSNKKSKAGKALSYYPNTVTNQTILTFTESKSDVKAVAGAAFWFGKPNVSSSKDADNPTMNRVYKYAFKTDANCFVSGDWVSIDIGTMEIKKGNSDVEIDDNYTNVDDAIEDVKGKLTDAASIGDIGNDWEEMYLDPYKDNEWTIQWSDWYENEKPPIIKMEYEERFI